MGNLFGELGTRSWYPFLLTALLCVFTTAVGCSSGSESSESGGAIQNNISVSFTADSIAPTLGNSGLTITIFGTNMLAENVSRVLFGSTVAFVEEWDEEGKLMKVRAPALPLGATNPAPVTIELADGTKDTIFPGFFYQNSANCLEAAEFPDIVSVDPINLVTDSEFIVRGVNFDIGALVMINGETANVLQVSADEITAELPDGLGDECELNCEMPVLVNNENGCTDNYDALVVEQGFGIAFEYPSLGNNMMGTGLAAARQSVDDATDSIPDFVNLTAENLIMQSGDVSQVTPIVWSRSFSDLGGTNGDLSCYLPDDTMLNQVKNIGDIDGDGFNDFAVTQAHITSSWPDPFEAESRMCLVSGKGLVLDDITLVPDNKYGLHVEGAGDHLLLARNFYLNTNSTTADRVDICHASEFADGDAGNNCTTPYASVTVASFSEHVGGLGRALLSLGDIDNDGSVEFVVGAPNAQVTPNDHGRVFIFSVEDVKSGISYRNKIEATFEYHNLGNALARVEDLDGDGVRDFIVGASGKVLAFSAKEFNESSTPPPPLFVIRGYQSLTLQDGINPFASTILAMDDAGDVNGDGKTDFVIGDYSFFAAPGMGAARGRAVVFSGALSPVDGMAVELFGRDSVLNTEYFGLSVAGVGDTNGDGFSEIAVGGPRQQSFIASTVYLYNMFADEVNYPPLP